MVTIAVVSILVVQNSLLCERKVQELKKSQIFHISCITRGLRVKRGQIFTWQTKVPNFFVCRVVIINNFRRGAQSYQLLVPAILDIFTMATSENEGIYFISYLLIHIKYFNGSGV